MVADPFEASPCGGTLALRASMRVGASPLPGALASLGLTALAVLAAGIVLRGALDLGGLFAPLALVLFLPIACLVLRFLRTHPHPRFGPANAVTVLRGGLAAIVGAFGFEVARLEGAADEPLLWGLAAASVVALSLDGIDGMLARRTGLASSFGARFDMETDAYLILVLCALALAAGKAGSFVLLIGLMRYGFCLWAALDPRLARPLAPSLRRKAVCVVQIVLLCLVLLPPVAPPVSGALAAAALLALAWSFATDIAVLLRRPA